MDTEIAVQDVLQDITPPLELSWGLLRDIIRTASTLPRNAQKTLYFISRVTEILKALRQPFSEPPLNLDDMMTAMESLRTLERTLIEAKSLIEKEAKLPTTFSADSKSTWEARHKKLYKLVTAVYASEFDPPEGWEEELKEIDRVDAHLWVGLIAHDMWDKSDLKDAEKAEGIAAKLLEEPQTEEEASPRKQDIEKVMEWWEGCQEEQRPFFDISLSSFALMRPFQKRKGSSGFTEIPSGETASDGDSGSKPQRPGLPGSGQDGRAKPSSKGADVKPEPSNAGETRLDEDWSPKPQRAALPASGQGGAKPSPNWADAKPKPSTAGETRFDGDWSPKPQHPALPVSGQGGGARPSPYRADVKPKPPNAQRNEPTTDPSTNPARTVSLSSDFDYKRATGGQGIDVGDSQDASGDEGGHE